MMMMTELFLLTILITVKLSVTQTGGQRVQNVSVQQGKSIIIPCLYNEKYKDKPKYLCFGSIWPFCKKVPNNTMVSISDDQTHHILTVAMANVTTADAGRYWCSIKLPSFDEKESFQLKVTKATPKLYVDDQMVTGYEGSHVVISCHHQTKLTRVSWCKIGDACVSTIGNISGASVRLSSTDGGFQVTMSKLTMDNTGWYWCSAGDEQMPVYITVQRSTPKSESFFAWLAFLGLLIAVGLACVALIVFRQDIKKNIFSLSKRTENLYVSMKKSNLQASQHKDEDIEAQEYEIMSSPKQTQEINPEGSDPPKTDGGHITHKDDFALQGPYCTC